MFIFNWIQCVWKYNTLFLFHYELQIFNGISILGIFQRSEQNIKFVKSQNICIDGNVDFLLKNYSNVYDLSKKKANFYLIAKRNQRSPRVNNCSCLGNKHKKAVASCEDAVSPLIYLM